MEKIRLGITALEVTPLALGTWQLGGEWGDFDQREAVAAIRRARELGVNFFDTAQAYGFGASERLLGEALRDELRQHRDELVIATKGGLRMTDHGMVRDSSREWLREGVEESLRALDLDHIDLYQVHWPDPDVAFSETAGALQELVDEGKIRHIGVSNFDVEEIDEFARWRPVETVQPPYHLFRRGIESDLLPDAQEREAIRTAATSTRCGNWSALPASAATRSPRWRSRGRLQIRRWTWRSWARAEPPTLTTASPLSRSSSGARTSQRSNASWPARKPLRVPRRNRCNGYRMRGQASCRRHHGWQRGEPMHGSTPKEATS
jgi:diketogulonate reductase-like aldo/keto reductase